jgi:hypothetical protein
MRQFHQHTSTPNDRIRQRALEQVGSLVSCFVSPFFDYGKHFFEFSELPKYYDAGLRDHVDFSFSSNGFYFNQPLLNQEGKVLFQHGVIEVSLVHDGCYLQRSPVCQNFQNINVHF